MAEWTNPIRLEANDHLTDCSQTACVCADLLILNQVLTQYDRNEPRADLTTLRQDLSAIDKAAETCIAHIPQAQRQVFMAEERAGLIAKHHWLTDVINRQRHAVSRIFLLKHHRRIERNHTATGGSAGAAAAGSAREFKPLTASAFSLMAAVFPGEKNDSNPLAPDYWPELTYEGHVAIAAWVNADENSANEFLSHNEVVVIDQETQGIGKQQVFYFNATKRAQHQLSFLDGLAYIDKGTTLFDSSEARGSHIDPGDCIFAMDLGGNIFSSDPCTFLSSSIHHSSLLAGRPVRCAGTIRAKNGKIIEITGDSGHYQPDRGSLVRLLTILETQHHLDLSDIRIKPRSNVLALNAKKYLTQKGFCLPIDTGLMLFRVALTEKMTVDAAEGSKNYKHYSRLLKIAAEKGNQKAKLKRAEYLIDKYYTATSDDQTASGGAAAAAAGASESPTQRKAIDLLRSGLEDTDTNTELTQEAQRLLAIARNRTLYLLIKGLTNTHSTASDKIALLKRTMSDVEDIDSLHIIYKLLTENMHLLQEKAAGRVRLGRQYGKMPEAIKTIQAQAINIADRSSIISDEDHAKFKIIFINRYGDKALKERYHVIKATKSTAAEDEATAVTQSKP